MSLPQLEPPLMSLPPLEPQSESMSPQSESESIPQSESESMSLLSILRLSPTEISEINLYFDLLREPYFTTVNFNFLQDIPIKMNEDKFIRKIKSCEILSDQTCSICLENLSDLSDKSDICEISCEHCYHSKCIKSWLYCKNSCPLCRKKCLQYNKDT